MGTGYHRDQKERDNVHPSWNSAILAADSRPAGFPDLLRADGHPFTETDAGFGLACYNTNPIPLVTIPDASWKQKVRRSEMFLPTAFRILKMLFPPGLHNAC